MWRRSVLFDRSTVHPSLFAIVLGAFCLLCAMLPVAPAEYARHGEEGRVSLDLRWRVESELDEPEREIARRERILLMELARWDDDHLWAGRYYTGDGLGVNVELLLAPSGGCLATWRGCLGLYGWNWGTVSERGGHLYLRFELPNEPGKWGQFDSAYEIVPLGEERALQSLDSQDLLERIAC